LHEPARRPIRNSSEQGDRVQQSRHSLCKKGEFDLAITNYTRAIEINAKYAIAYTNRCDAFRSKGELDRAIGDCDRAIKLDPKNAIAHITRGFAYWDKGDYDLAIASHTKAIEINPKSAMAYVSRCNEYRAKSELDRAIRDCDQAIKLDSKSSAAYSSRCLVYNDKREYDRAMVDCDEAIKLDSKNVGAYNNRCLVYISKRAYDHAIADCDQSIKLDSKYPITYAHRGIAYEGKGVYYRATENYRTALGFPVKSLIDQRAHEIARQRLANLETGSSPPSPVPSQPPAKPDQQTSGTGVLVSKDGNILTNAHVLRDCGRVQVSRTGSASETAHLVAADETNDLALLKADIAISILPSFRRGVRVGENIFVYGFPLAGLLATSGNFTAGNIRRMPDSVTTSGRCKYLLLCSQGTAVGHCSTNRAISSESSLQGSTPTWLRTSISRSSHPSLSTSSTPTELRSRHLPMLNRSRHPILPNAQARSQYTLYATQRGANWEGTGN
jgi:tetratricopeptide (TPR) repeat protein